MTERLTNKIDQRNAAKDVHVVLSEESDRNSWMIIGQDRLKNSQMSLQLVEQAPPKGSAKWGSSSVHPGCRQ